ncbi:MAG: hypothetical protein K0B85_10485 [Coriobacteriia bacterium]|nr:hypothetical protein [Coriobacteriia bacterium]
MKRWLVTLALGAALLAGGAIAAWANDTAIGGAGGTVSPLADDGIRLEAETVQVIAYRRFAAYRVDFKFVNEGPAKKLLLGFPFPQGMEPESPHLPPASVRAWQGDTPLEVTMVEGTDGEDIVEYWTHEVDFPAGETFVRVEYYAAPTITVGGAPDGILTPAPWQEFDSWQALYPYTVHTGAGWAGTIGTTLIRYTFTDDVDAWGADDMLAYTVDMLAENDLADDARIYGAYTRPELGVYQWIFEDFEPTRAHDIGVPFLQPVRRTLADDTAPGTERSPADVIVTASSWLDLGEEFQYRPGNVADGFPSTAWAEDAEGSGIGEWLRFEFGAPRAVREVQVLPGYAKTAELFSKYNRPKTLYVEFSDGTGVELPLADEPVLQTFPVRADAEWVEVSIRDVYPGTTRDETYLAEIEFAESASPQFASFADLMGETESPDEEPPPAEEPTVGPDVPESADDEGWPAETWMLLAALAVLAAVLVGAVVAQRRRTAGRGESEGE